MVAVAVTTVDVLVANVVMVALCTITSVNVDVADAVAVSSIVNIEVLGNVRVLVRDRNVGGSWEVDVTTTASGVNVESTTTSGS